MKTLKCITAVLLLTTGLVNGTAQVASDCGPYPVEFASLCPPNTIMIAVCTGDPPNWEFIGCWEF